MGMPPQTFDVRGNVPVAVAASPLPEPLTVLNMAVETVIYLSGEPGNKGFPLSPGSTMTWDSGQRLYITCDDGSVARIGVVYNGGQIIDSRALAQQIISAGLADEIATKISLVGIPTIDRPKNLVSVVYKPFGGGDTILTAGDVAGYSSLTGFVRLSSSSSLGATLTVVQAYTDLFDPGQTTTYRYVFDGPGEARFVIPLVGNLVALYLDTVGGISNRYDAEFYASYRERSESITVAVDEWSVLSSGLGTVNESSTQATLTVPANTRTLYSPWWASGQFVLSWGFATAVESAKNTAGFGLTFGPRNSPGLNTEQARGIVGNNPHNTTDTGLNTHTGILGRERPRLAVINRNNVPISINYQMQTQL